MENEKNAKLSRPEVVAMRLMLCIGEATQKGSDDGALLGLQYLCEQEGMTADRFRSIMLRTADTQSRGENVEAVRIFATLPLKALATILANVYPEAAQQVMTMFAPQA